MTAYLLTILTVSGIIVVSCLFVGLYDRQYRNMQRKRDWLIGVITVSAGIFSAVLTSAYYMDGWSLKYLAPILLFAAATAAVIAYTCLLKKIYTAKAAEQTARGQQLEASKNDEIGENDKIGKNGGQANGRSGEER